MRAHSLIVNISLAAAVCASTPAAQCTFEGLGTPSSSVEGFAVWDDGNGPALYMTGTSLGLGGATQVARWDGSGWGAVGDPFGNNASAIHGFDDGNGPALYVNSFWQVSQYRGGNWTALSGFLCCVSSFGVDRVASPPRLIAGGTFTTVGGQPAQGVATWDGRAWSTLGTNGPVIANCCDQVRAILTFDDGSGPALYVGGTFPAPYEDIARWDGLQWEPVGSGFDFGVDDLCVYDDGSGPALYACGQFNRSRAGTDLNGVARWDGQRWTPVGGGVAPASFSRVFDLEVFDDGTGPELYAGGEFSSAGGVAGAGLAKWNGTRWAAVGSGVTGGAREIRALEVFDDGTGAALYIGGFFDTINGQPFRSLARLRCASTISVTPRFDRGALTLVNANLVPGAEYYNVISLEPCTPLGGGSLLGLCATHPANRAFLAGQIAAPIGTAPTHVRPTGSYTSWPALPLPVVDAIDADVVCFEVRGGALGAVSSVARVTLR